MKDEMIRIRVSTQEKLKVKADAESKGFPDVSAYLMTLAGVRKLPRLKK